MARRQVSFIYFDKQVTRQHRVIDCHPHEAVHQGLGIVHVFADADTKDIVGVDLVRAGRVRQTLWRERVHYEPQDLAVAFPDIYVKFFRVFKLFRNLNRVIISGLPVDDTPELKRLVTLGRKRSAVILISINEIVLPPFDFIVFALVDSLCNSLRVEERTTAQGTQLRAGQLVTLDDKIAFINRVAVRVWVEVPDRRVRYFRHGAQGRVVLALVVPVRVFFRRRKRSFDDAGAEKCALESRVT